MRTWLERMFFAPATPTNLAVVRIGLFSTVVVYALQESVERAARAAFLNWRPTSFFGLLGAPPTAGSLRVVQMTLVAAGLLAAVGLFTRISQLIATPLAAFLLGFDSNMGKINHRSMLLVLLLIAIVPARLGDALSIDRLITTMRSRRRDPVLPDPRYRWPVALCQVTVVSVYLFAGVSKIVNGGAEWFTVSAFQRFLYVRLDQLPDPPSAGLWLADQPYLAQAVAIASVVFELSMVLILFRPRLRNIAIPALIVFHEATLALTEIDFRRTMIAALIPLVDYEAVTRRLTSVQRRVATQARTRSQPVSPSTPGA